MSGIEWTEKTWNPIVGCSVVSAGCTNCYAMKEAGTRRRHTDKYKGLTEPSKAGPVWNGEIRFWEPALEEVTKRKKPTIWFVDSMGDLFHESIPLKDIKRVFEAMQANPQHQFQVLTKRAERLAELADQLDWPENVWMGVSVEREDVVDRIDHLRKVPAHIRFLCLEPLIGPLPNLNLEGIHWVTVGGESGKDHRPMEDDWVRGIRDQCQANEVAFFFKQWGGRTSKSGGKELDGREWLEYPANVDMSRYEKAKKLTEVEVAEQVEKLQETAAKVKALIEKAETGRVDAYVKAGKELNAAKIAVKKTGQKWGEWLEEQGIPQRTATRAMQYARNPEKYTEERVQDALSKREKRKENGQMSGQKRALLKALHEATDSEIEALYELMIRNESLKRLRDMIPAEYRSKANGSPEQPGFTSGNGHENPPQPEVR